MADEPLGKRALGEMEPRGIAIPGPEMLQAARTPAVGDPGPYPELPLQDVRKDRVAETVAGVDPERLRPRRRAVRHGLQLPADQVLGRLHCSRA